MRQTYNTMRHYDYMTRYNDYAAMCLCVKVTKPSTMRHSALRKNVRAALWLAALNHRTTFSVHFKNNFENYLWKVTPSDNCPRWAVQFTAAQ